MRGGAVETHVLARAIWTGLDANARARLSRMLDGRAEDAGDHPVLAALMPLHPSVAVALRRARDGADLMGRLIEAVRRDDPAAAQAALADEGGAFLAITRGPQRATEVSACLPETWRQDHLTLALLDIVTALKSGDMARADVLVAHLGRRMRLPDLADCGPGHDPTLVAMLFMKAIYADDPIPAAARGRLFAVISDLPPEARVLRGVMYNVALDLLLRQNDLAAAREAAGRAIHHYEAAGEGGLAFYVHLYLALMAQWAGEDAGAAIAAAEVALAQRGAPDPNDALLLRHRRLIHAYEAGDPEPLVAALIGGEELIPFGELWPAMAEPILAYGRRALAVGVTPAAELAWVRRWQVRQWRSDRFHALISAQEALALQGLGRWQEADEVLGGLRADEGEAALARLDAALERGTGTEAVRRLISGWIGQGGGTLRHQVSLRLRAAQVAAAREAMRLHVGEPLGLSVEAAAAAVSEIVNANMANASHLVTTRRGLDPRDFALVAAGGAGALHAGRQAQLLGMASVIVPATAPVFCALGDTVAHLKVSDARTYLASMESLDLAELNERFDEMERAARARLAHQQVTTQFELRRAMDLRYAGEVHEVTVPLRTRTRRVTALNIEATLRAFHDLHETLFAHKDVDHPVEVLTLRVDVLGLRTPPQLAGAEFGDEDASPARKGARPITFAEGTCEAAVYDGAKLRPGHFLSGPAAIESWGTTIIVCPGQEALIDAQGNCIIENGAGA